MLSLEVLASRNTAYPEICVGILQVMCTSFNHSSIPVRPVPHNMHNQLRHKGCLDHGDHLPIEDLIKWPRPIPRDVDPKRLVF